MLWSIVRLTLYILLLTKRLLGYETPMLETIVFYTLHKRLRSFTNWHVFVGYKEEGSYMTTLLRGPSRKFGSNCRIFFFWRNFIFRVWMITCQNHMSVRVQEKPENLRYTCIICIYRFSLSRLCERFPSFLFFQKQV